MQRRKKTLSAMALCSAILISSATAAQAGKADIVDTAVKAGSFNTLVAAVKAAGLVDTLKGHGPFTVFAPTDEAFSKLPEGTVENLLKPENRQLLQSILTYHVVAGNVPASKVVKLKNAGTVNGQRVDIQVGKGGVQVDGANVVTTDIHCKNGVIHVIDKVIMPSSDDIVDTASKAGSFGTLLAAAKAAGLVETLKGKGPLTVFAPTDAAFAKLPAGTVESLLKPENKGKLAAILTYHVVPGRIYSGKALAAGTAQTVQGNSISITSDGAGARINQSNLLTADIDASNGVIHVIDSVLMPGDAKVKKTAQARRMIELAIHRGVPLYNAGHAEACAAIYETAARGVMSMANEELCHASKKRMQTTLTQVANTDCADKRAWMLRHALDGAHASLMN